MQGFERLAAVLFERVTGERAEVANLALQTLALGLERSLFAHQPLHLALVVRQPRLGVLRLAAETFQRRLALLHGGRSRRQLCRELRVKRRRLSLVRRRRRRLSLRASQIRLHAADVHLGGGGLDLPLPALEVRLESRRQLAELSLGG